MTFDLTDKYADSAYKILTGLVTPRPIAWVTTQNLEGVVNAAPFSFFNVFGSKPPMLAFAPGDRSPGVPKDTALNIRLQGEFVVNLVDEDVADAMVGTAAALEAGVSELEGSGLTTVPSDTIAPPRIKESPVSLECVRHSVVEVGQNRLVIGLVKRVHVREGIMDPESCRVDVSAFKPVGRMASPSWYVRCKDLFEL